MKRLLVVPAVLFSLVVYAQMAGTYPRTVGVVAPDGGVPINGSTNSTIVLPDGGTQVLQVEGRSGGPLLTSIDGTPTVTLDSASLAAIAAPTCTVASLPPVITLTTTPVDVPTVALTGRTQLIVKNLSGARDVWCCVGVACIPTATEAYVILQNGDYQNFPVRDSLPVRCRSAVGTADVNAQEASCV